MTERGGSVKEVAGENPLAEVRGRERSLGRRLALRAALAGALGSVAAILAETRRPGKATADSGPTVFDSTTSADAVYGHNTSTTVNNNGNFGIHGVSANGIGISGSSNSDANGVLGTNSSDIAAAIEGQNAESGPGVLGSSTSGNGVAGTSTGGNGVVGVTSSGNLTSAGVVGQNTAGGAGVVANTTGSALPAAPASNIGVWAFVDGTGPAVQADTNGTGPGVYANAYGGGVGVLGYGLAASGVVGVSHGPAPGVAGQVASDSYAGVEGENAGRGPAVLGSNTGGGPGVQGTTSSASGSSGVYGTNTGGGAAVAGVGSGGTGTSTNLGVYGQAIGSAAGIGVLGYCSNNVNSVGVYGQSTTGKGFLGFSLSAQGTGAVGINTAGGVGIIGASQGGSGSGYGVISSGNCYVSGALTVTGAKSAAVRDAGGTLRRLYCMESPESWFEDFGSGQLSGGSATVQLEPHFAELVRTDGYHVFPVPEGDSKGLYVSGKTPTSFAVREQQNGTSSIGFSYRIVAKRRDITGVRLEEVQEPPELEIPEPITPPPIPPATSRAQ